MLNVVTPEGSEPPHPLAAPIARQQRAIGAVDVRLEIPSTCVLQEALARDERDVDERVVPVSYTHLTLPTTPYV